MERDDRIDGLYAIIISVLFILVLTFVLFLGLMYGQVKVLKSEVKRFQGIEEKFNQLRIDSESDLVLLHEKVATLQRRHKWLESEE